MLGASLRRILQHFPFRRRMQQIGVDGERRFAFLVLGDGDLVIARELQQFLATLECPFAPWRDDLDAGLERVIGQLEAHLVVALAGGAVTDGVGADLARDFDLLLGDQRPRDRGAEQVLAFIDGVGAEHRKHEVAHEFLAQVLDEDVLRLDTGAQRLVARGAQLLALAEIGGEGHDLAAIGGLQPLQDDRGIEPAGIGEHDFLGALFGLAWHGASRSRPGTGAFTGLLNSGWRRRSRGGGSTWLRPHRRPYRRCRPGWRASLAGRSAPSGRSPLCGG